MLYQDKKRHPLLSFPYVKDAPWPDGSDNRFEQGVKYCFGVPFVFTREDFTSTD